MAPADTIPLYRIVYVSSACQPLFAEKLDRIVLRARVANRLVRIGGLLLFREGRFLQVIEGPEAAALTLAQKIGRDRQHRDMRVIASGPCLARLFPDPLGYLPARRFSDAQGVAFDQLAAMQDGASADLAGLRVEALLALFREVQAA